MRRYGYILLAGVMLFAVGCSSGASTAGSDASASGTDIVTDSEEAGTQSQKDEEEGSEDSSVKEAQESLKEAEESLKAREESLKEAEESLAEVQSSMAEETENLDVTYRQLVAAPNEYVNKNVIYSGEIVRSAAVDSASVQIVLAVDGNNQTQLVGEYKKSIVAGTLKVGDRIRVSGPFVGMMRYRMNSGNIENLPTVTIKEIDQVVKAAPETQPVTQPETTREETTAVPETAVEEVTGTDEIPTEPESQTSPVISAGQQ